MDARSTIVGVATGTPDGGVAIVRVSGPGALAVVASQVVGGLPPARVAGLRRLVGDEQGLVVVMPGPRSFTGEDVVELHVHAGARNVARVVEGLIVGGAEPATAGAFTRRAFENGRLSLDQAEGIAAVIGAQTDAALDQARRLVAGQLGREVEAVGARVERVRIEVEANLDFPEDVAAADLRRLVDALDELGADIEGWLAGFERGRRARERARVVIAGPPNAGKSALFNALLGRKRALVSATPGTTRDYVEAELRLESGGRELSLVDTAGLRESDDTIEIAGVELGREQIAGADVIVWVEGADQAPGSSADIGMEERAALARGAGATRDRAPVIEVENKRDLGTQRPGWIGVSAASQAGLDDLREAIARAARVDGEQWIGLARHRDRAREAAIAVAEARRLLAVGVESVALELVALELAVATRSLGEITGRAELGPVGEELLHAIFAGFCIGK